ncbi:polyhydroxyalkanoate synthesis repressor PhaR [Oceanospirillum sediminis]|uniref:Polyhydroxyalkanoate synthesis repressor PhaR n=1 Tax=Oceanospirillum sediminis TaxID=2760088 RepID=A0A839ILM8_9GAMM|nr:polyhydroxyalkanoate synthesis repressor PhaR [Oceanospirillum sediminis]MBB1485226.1 polyhydroxyalkanoate synthesis repressor PhaR [Oceanospirillum sediminis]
MRVIRKYANRRLYDTSESRYVTLEDIKQLVINKEEFRVEDSKSGDDLTRNILLQIITEQENTTGGGSNPMFSNQVLQQLIRFYGDSMQGTMSNYLEESINTFLEQQKLLRDQMQSAITSNPMTSNPMELMRRVAEQNMKIWQTFQPKSPKSDDD